VFVLGRQVFNQLYRSGQKVIIRLLETKFTKNDFQDIPLPSAFSEGYVLEHLPVWMRDMTRVQCGSYFEMMMLRRLVQLSSQGHVESKRNLALAILYRRNLKYPIPLASVDSDHENGVEIKELLKQGIYLLAESGNGRDVEALISLGWLLYFDHQGKHVRH